jgi:hypothetical protein
MMAVDIHARSLQASSMLSGYYMPHAVLPGDVISALTAQRIDFMLVGAHGIGGWMDKPRATEDVDVLVGARQHRKAIRVLQQAFPTLEYLDTPVVARFRDNEIGKVVIDVIKPNQPLFRGALKHAHTVHANNQVYKIPSLELALAMKFAAMISPHRGTGERHMDAHDFILMVQANRKIDLAALAEFGERVYRNGGGEEIIEKVQAVRGGKQLEI